MPVYARPMVDQEARDLHRGYRRGAHLLESAVIRALLVKPILGPDEPLRRRRLGLALEFEGQAPAKRRASIWL